MPTLVLFTVFWSTWAVGPDPPVEEEVWAKQKPVGIKKRIMRKKRKNILPPWE
jgi:hypothetical protein